MSLISEPQNEDGKNSHPHELHTVLLLSGPGHQCYSIYYCTCQDKKMFE